MIANNLFYPDTLLTISEVSKISGFSKSTLYKDISKSKHNHIEPMLPFCKLGGRIFYRSRDIHSVIDKAFDRSLNFF